jgi:hypothetical protein
MKSKLGENFFTTLSFWKLNVVLWLLFGLLCLVTKVFFYPNLAAGLALLLINLILALALTAQLREIYRRTLLKDFFGFKTLLLVLLCSLVAALIQAETAQGIVNHMAWGSPHLPQWLALSHRLEFTWILFVAWGLGYYGLKAKLEAYHEMLRGRKSRSEARNLELQLLRNRIDPHFLFNSLNGIAAEIAPHPAAASELVHDVAAYLRYILDHRDLNTSPLAREIDAMAAYLKIEKGRFGERLQVSLKATRAARKTRVPSFILQPLVENAVKHAAWPDDGPLTINILATKEENTLVISVSNTGELKKEGSDGVGLSTLRRLLELQYPGRNEFHLSEQNDNVIAQLKLQGLPCSVS